MKLSSTKLVIVTILSFAFNPLAAQDYNKGLAAYNDGNFLIAVGEWTPLAEKGDTYAQRGLGFMYRTGQGIPQDFAEAIKWYRLAAEQGDDYSQYDLGVMYARGQGTTEDFAEAVKWYRLAAEQGNALAQANLGFSYRNGQGVPQDDAEAAK